VILADSGVLIAAANHRDKHHQACEALVRQHRGALLVSPLTIAEVCHMIGKLAGPRGKAAFLDAFSAGALVLATVTSTDTARMAALIREYPKLDLDGADSSIIALAERLGLDMVATIDRRDFTVVRPTHVPALRLLPE